MNTQFAVGGGMPFPSTPTTGTENIAAGLAPPGTAPVAFFPPAPAQSVQAFSVIFSEVGAIGKRRKRSADRGKANRDNFFYGIYLWFNPMPNCSFYYPYIHNAYMHNFIRF